MIKVTSALLNVKVLSLRFVQDFTPPEGGIHRLSDNWKTGKGFALQLKEVDLVTKK